MKAQNLMAELVLILKNQNSFTLYQTRGKKSEKKKKKEKRQKD